MRRGALIAFEGCGQIKQSEGIAVLASRLEDVGMRVKIKQFPDLTTHTGQRIAELRKQKTIVNPTTFELLFSANRWEHAQSIIDDLNNGITLIIDGYSMSGIACGVIYTGDNIEDQKLLEQGLPAPDFIVAFDAASGEFGDLSYDLQKKAFKVLKTLQDGNHWYFVKPSPLSLPIIYDNLFLIIQRVAFKVSTRPILKLFEKQ